MPSPAALHSALYSSTHSKRGKATGDKICECAFKLTSRGDQWVKIYKFGCVSQCYYLIGDAWRTLWTPIGDLSPPQRKCHYFCRFRSRGNIAKPSSKIHYNINISLSGSIAPDNSRGSVPRPRLSTPPRLHRAPRLAATAVA